MRVGIGFDVHRLVESRPLIIGGVTIPYHLGLQGHSDADVLLHAIADGLLGAAGLGDIGMHFPDTDPQYLGISSMTLLSDVKQKIMKAGFDVNNVDAVIVAQQPKMAPYIPEMKLNIARVLEVGAQAVNIKATTTERLGFTGRGEGIAAWAAVTLHER